MRGPLPIARPTITEPTIAAARRRRVALLGLFVANAALLIVAMPAIVRVAEILGSLEVIWSAWLGSGGPSPPSFDGVFAWIRDYPAEVISLWWEIGFHRSDEWIALGMILLVAAAPVLLIAPVVSAPAIADHAKSLRASTRGAAIIAGGLTTGALAALIELVYLAATWSTPSVNRSDWFGFSPSSLLDVALVVLIVWFCFGLVWTALLRTASARHGPRRLGTIVRWLLAGSALELVLAVSVLTWGRRRDSCLCGWSSFWAIVYGLSTLLLLCGPAVILLATRRSRASWARMVCRACGYPRRTNASACSECGCVHASPPSPPSGARASRGPAESC